MMDGNQQRNKNKIKKEVYTKNMPVLVSSNFFSPHNN